MADLFTLLTEAILLVGSFFVLVGSIGLIRMPDVYNRLHSATKLITLGGSSILLATALRLGPTSAGTKALLCIVFLYLTAPVGAHMVARAAERLGVGFTDWRE